MSLRARTPSVERRPETDTKQLRFPRSNLPSTKNLTLLIRPRRDTQAQDSALLPVEVVAVGGKPGDQAATTGHTYTATSSQVQYTQYGFRVLIEAK